MKFTIDLGCDTDNNTLAVYWVDRGGSPHTTEIDFCVQPAHNGTHLSVYVNDVLKAIHDRSDVVLRATPEEAA